MSPYFTEIKPRRDHYIIQYNLLCIKAIQCCPNFSSPEYSHSQKMKMWLLPESSSRLNGNNVLIAEQELLQVRFEAEKEGKGMAITMWPFLKWFPFFHLRNIWPDKNEHQAKLLVSLGPFCTGCLHTGPDVCWLINKPAWRPQNKWTLTFSAACRITCAVSEDTHSTESLSVSAAVLVAKLCFCW